jgi:hypothetical protein
LPTIEKLALPLEHRKETADAFVGGSRENQNLAGTPCEQ